MNRRQLITRGISTLTIATPVAISQSTRAQEVVTMPSLFKASGPLGWFARMRSGVDPKGLCCLLGPYCQDEKPPDCEIDDYPL